MRNEKLSDFLDTYRKESNPDFGNFETDSFSMALRLEIDNRRNLFNSKWSQFLKRLSLNYSNIFDDTLDVSRSFIGHLTVSENLYLTVEVSLIGDFYSCFFSEISDFKVTLFKGELDFEKERILLNVQEVLLKYFNYSKVEENDFKEIVPGVFVEGYYESSYGTSVHNILFGISKISIND